MGRSFVIVWPLIASGLAVLSLGAGCAEPSPRERVGRYLESLDWRPPVGRLCCGLAYPDAAAGTPPPTYEAAEFERLYGALARSHRRAPSAECLAGLAALEMLRAEWSAAIERLEQAVRLDPGRADLRSDLAAALLTRAQTGDRSIDLLAALRHALEATELDPDLPEGWFNRAEILGRLTLWRAAGEAWARFESLEPDPKWLSEARARSLEGVTERTGIDGAALVQRLEAGDEIAADELRWLVERRPHVVRELGEERLLGRWGRAVEGGRSEEAARLLAQIGRLGAELAERWGDWMLADAAEHIQRAVSGGSGLDEIAAAYRAYGEGMRAYYGREFAQADRELAAAESILLRTGGRLASSAALYRAICAYERNVPSSRPLLGAVADSVDAERYPSLAGRVDWMRGLVEMVQGNFEGAISYYERTRELLARGAGPERTAVADLLLADAYDLRGEVERGWGRRLAVARQLSSGGDPRRRHAVLQASARSLVEREQCELALVFIEEEVANAAEWGEPAASAEALAQRARVHSQMGEWELAERDARRAIEIAEGIPDAAARRRVEASSRLSLGIAQAVADPANALQTLRQAEAEHEEIGWGAERFAFYEAAARAHLALGEIEAARKILLTSVHSFEEIRRQAIDIRSRILIFRHARKAFDRLLELALDDPEGAVEPAFELAERARARYLLDRWSGRDEPAGLEEIQNGITAGTYLVQYAVLPERVVAWVLDGQGIRRVEIGAPSPLERAAADLELALEVGRDRSVPELSSALYDALIRPLGLDLDAGDRLVVVPEGWLAQLPFAALWDSQQREYLIEQSAVTFAPSSTLYVRAAQEARNREAGSRSALVVGEPDLSASEWSDLPALPLAAEETSRIAESYPEHVVLRGREASAAAFLAELGEYQVVHFAGHAIVGSDEIGDARLLLSPGREGESGAVAAETLWAMHLEKTELVVLAACHGLGGLEHGREGVVSLASSFFAAGVPSVVAALWKVDDSVSLGLMVRLHELLAAGELPTEALRRVMIEEIRSGDAGRSTPAHWGVFAVLGV